MKNFELSFDETSTICFTLSQRINYFNEKLENIFTNSYYQDKKELQEEKIKYYQEIILESKNIIEKFGFKPCI